jgi:hypothetical protein
VFINIKWQKTEHSKTYKTVCLVIQTRINDEFLHNLDSGTIMFILKNAARKMLNSKHESSLAESSFKVSSDDRGILQPDFMLEMRPILPYSSLLPGFDQMLHQEYLSERAQPTNLDKIRLIVRDSRTYEKLNEFIEQDDWFEKPDEMNFDASCSHFLLDIKLNKNQVIFRGVVPLLVNFMINNTCQSH